RTSWTTRWQECASHPGGAEMTANALEGFVSGATTGFATPPGARRMRMIERPTDQRLIAHIQRCGAVGRVLLSAVDPLLYDPSRVGDVSMRRCVQFAGGRRPR